MKTFVFAILLLGVSASGGAQWLDHPTAGIPRTANGDPNLAAPTPRTADGKPDFSGLWTRTTRTYAGAFKPLDPSVTELVDQRAEKLSEGERRGTVSSAWTWLPRCARCSI